jgi:hypothetical protein
MVHGRVMPGFPGRGDFTLFFCHQKKSVQKKSARLLFRPSASLRFSTDAGAAELTCLRQVQTVLALFPRLSAMFGETEGRVFFLSDYYKLLPEHGIIVLGSCRY